jgi:hypothetical protein
MCVEGWKREDYPYNPAGIKVLTREYPHQPSSVFTDIRYRSSVCTFTPSRPSSSLCALCLAL